MSSHLEREIQYSILVWVQVQIVIFSTTFGLEYSSLIGNGYQSISRTICSSSEIAACLKTMEDEPITAYCCGACVIGKVTFSLSLVSNDSLSSLLPSKIEGSFTVLCSWCLFVLIPIINYFSRSDVIMSWINYLNPLWINWLCSQGFAGFS